MTLESPNILYVTLGSPIFPMWHWRAQYSLCDTGEPNIPLHSMWHLGSPIFPYILCDTGEPNILLHSMWHWGAQYSLTFYVTLEHPIFPYILCDTGESQYSLTFYVDMYRQVIYYEMFEIIIFVNMLVNGMYRVIGM